MPGSKGSGGLLAHSLSLLSGASGNIDNQSADLSSSSSTCHDEKAENVTDSNAHSEIGSSRSTDNDVAFLECYECGGIVCPRTQRYCPSCLDPLQASRPTVITTPSSSSTSSSSSSSVMDAACDGGHKSSDASLGKLKKNDIGSSLDPNSGTETVTATTAEMEMFYVGDIAYFCNKAYQEVTKGRIIQFICDSDTSLSETAKSRKSKTTTSSNKRNNNDDEFAVDGVTALASSNMSVRMRYEDPTWAFERYDEVHPLSAISRDIDRLSASIGKRSRALRRILEPTMKATYHYNHSYINNSNAEETNSNNNSVATAITTMPTKRSKRRVEVVKAEQEDAEGKGGEDAPMDTYSTNIITHLPSGTLSIDSNTPTTDTASASAVATTTNDATALAPTKRSLPRRLSAFKLPRRIHALFHSGGDPSRFKQANIEVLSSDPPVYKIKKFLTKEELSFFTDYCAKQCTSFENSFTENEAGDAVISEERTSTYKWFGKAANKTVCLIEKKAADFVGLSVDHVEPLQVVSYTEGQLFGEHHDAGIIRVYIYVSFIMIYNFATYCICVYSRHSARRRIA